MSTFMAGCVNLRFWTMMTDKNMEYMMDWLKIPDQLYVGPFWIKKALNKMDKMFAYSSYIFVINWEECNVYWHDLTQQIIFTLQFCIPCIYIFGYYLKRFIIDWFDWVSAFWYWNFIPWYGLYQTYMKLLNNKLSVKFVWIKINFAEIC